MTTPLWIVMLLVPSLVAAAPSNAEKDMKGPSLLKNPTTESTSRTPLDLLLNAAPTLLHYRKSFGSEVMERLSEMFRDWDKSCPTAISSFHRSAPKTTDKRFTLRSTLVSPRIKSVPSFRGMFTSEPVSWLFFSILQGHWVRLVKNRMSSVSLVEHLRTLWQCFVGKK